MCLRDQGKIPSLLLHSGEDTSEILHPVLGSAAGSCENSRDRLFLIAAARDTSHKLLLGMFRMDFRKVSLPWGQCNTGGVCGKVVRSQISITATHLSHIRFSITATTTSFHEWTLFSSTPNTLQWLLFPITLWLKLFFSCSRGEKDITHCFLSTGPDFSYMGPVLPQVKNRC